MEEPKRTGKINNLQFATIQDNKHVKNMYRNEEIGGMLSDVCNGVYSAKGVEAFFEQPIE